MEGDRGHPPFVRFARAIHIEIAETGNLRIGVRQALANDLVEQEF